MQKIIMGLMGALLICGMADAGMVKVKAKGLASYGMFAGRDVRKAAIEDAKKNALQSYAAKFDSARFKVFQTKLPEMVQRIDYFVVNYEIIEDGKNKVSKNYEVVLEASIDENRIEQQVSQASEAIAGPSGGDAPYIAFVMVSRQASSVKTFKDKKTDITQTSKNTAEAMAVSDDGEMKTSAEVTDIQTTGGSVERKAADVNYRVFSTPDADNAMSEVFSKAGFEVVDPIDVDIDVSAFESDYSSGSKVSPMTRKSAISMCREYEISFLVIGNMEVGIPDIDPATGLSRVYVKVTAAVSGLTGRLPKKVASVAGIQYAGLGPDPMVAQQNALNTAARNSSADIVDQLRSKGVRTN